jgi:hypothetical protein
MFVHPGILWLWGIILVLFALVGLAAVSNTLHGGWGLVLVPGTIGVLSLLPRFPAIDACPYLLRFIGGALNETPKSQKQTPQAS